MDRRKLQRYKRIFNLARLMSKMKLMNIVICCLMYTRNLYMNHVFIGAYTFTKSEIGVSGRMSFDKTVRFEVVANLKTEAAGPGWLLTPLLNIDVPRMTPIKLTGAFEYRPMKMLDTKLSLSGLTKFPIVLKCKPMFNIYYFSHNLIGNYNWISLLLICY